MNYSPQKSDFTKNNIAMDIDLNISLYDLINFRDDYIEDIGQKNYRDAVCEVLRKGFFKP